MSNKKYIVFDKTLSVVFLLSASTNRQTSKQKTEEEMDTLHTLSTQNTTNWTAFGILCNLNNNNNNNNHLVRQ